jgi:hypothetical protein
MRVSHAARAFVDDSLTTVTVPRCCCRPGCPRYAVATLTFVYSDSTAVIGPLATAREPHSWDLCVSHASRITAPRGWELVRHAEPLAVAHPDDDDLVALADAVREGPEPAAPARGWSPQTGPADGGADSGADNWDVAAARGGVLAPSGQRPASNGRRRGHLRVLPDPGD